MENPIISLKKIIKDLFLIKGHSRDFLESGSNCIIFFITYEYKYDIMDLLDFSFNISPSFCFIIQSYKIIHPNVVFLTNKFCKIDIYKDIYFIELKNINALKTRELKEYIKFINNKIDYRKILYLCLIPWNTNNINNIIYFFNNIKIFKYFSFIYIELYLPDTNMSFFHPDFAKMEKDYIEYNKKIVNLLEKFNCNSHIKYRFLCCNELDQDEEINNINVIYARKYYSYNLNFKCKNKLLYYFIYHVINCFVLYAIFIFVQSKKYF